MLPVIVVRFHLSRWFGPRNSFTFSSQGKTLLIARHLNVLQQLSVEPLYFRIDQFRSD